VSRLRRRRLRRRTESPVPDGPSPSGRWRDADRSILPETSAPWACARRTAPWPSKSRSACGILVRRPGCGLDTVAGASPPGSKSSSTSSPSSGGTVAASARRPPSWGDSATAPRDRNGPSSSASTAATSGSPARPWTSAAPSRPSPGSGAATTGSTPPWSTCRGRAAVVGFPRPGHLPNPTTRFRIRSGSRLTSGQDIPSNERSWQQVTGHGLRWLRT
jgi:hypothetical protein